MHTITHKYKKGQKLVLDYIYDIQGLAGGNWWEPVVEGGEEIIIVKDVEIVIKWRVGK